MRGRRVDRAERPASDNERAEKPTGRENMVAKGPIGAAHAPSVVNTRRALSDIGNLVDTAATRGQVIKDGIANPVKQELVTTWGTKQRRSAGATREAVKVTAAVEVKSETLVDKSETSSNASSSDQIESATIPGLPPPVPRLKPVTTRDKPASVVKKVPSLTATLTARSVACHQHDAEQLESDNQLHNIDEADTDNQLAVVDYVEDIYSFYFKAEVQSCVAPDYMRRQADIDDKMRGILIDWLMGVQQKFGLMPETLFLTTNLIDRYLSITSVSRKNLQLVGVTAMLLAAKYEEIIAPEIETIIFISDDTYTREQVLAMEKAILNSLRFNLTVPTPYVFIVRFLKAASSDKQMELLAFFLVELCLTEYVMVKYRPSHLAAAAVYTANHTLGRQPCWTPTLVRYSGYTETQLKCCSRMMVKFHHKAGQGKVLMVHKKYSSSNFQSVASLPPAEIPDS